MQHPLDKLIIPFVMKMKYSGSDLFDNSPKWLILWIFLFTLNVLWLITLIIDLIYLDDLDDLGDILLGLGAQSLNVLNFILLKINAIRYVALLKIIREQFHFEINAKRNNQYKFLLKVVKIYFYNTSFVIALFLAFPLFQLLVYKKRSFPYPILKPDLLKYSPFYEITYVVQVASTWFGVVYANILSDVVFCLFVGFALIQIDIIKERIEGLLDGNYDKNEAYAILSKLAMHHDTILRFLKEVNAIFTYSLFTRYVFGGISVLGTGYIYAIAQSRNIATPFYFIVFVGQFLLINSFGEYVTTQCQSIGEIAYNIKWENKCNHQITLGLKLIILRTQKPFLISVGGVTELSLANYAQFMKALFSYYVVIKNCINNTNNK